MEPAAVQSWSVSGIWQGVAPTLQHLNSKAYLFEDRRIILKRYFSTFLILHITTSLIASVLRKRCCSFPQNNKTILSAFKTRSDLYYEKGGSLNYSHTVSNTPHTLITEHTTCAVARSNIHLNTLIHTLRTLWYSQANLRHLESQMA